jgi:predicted nucleotidyltransferase
VSNLSSTVETYLKEVTECLEELLGADLVGVYLHGSAVLGDFSEDRSDVDVLAVSSRSLSPEEKKAITEQLSQALLPCPATGLEFHAVCRGDIAARKAPPFELHLATSTDGRPDRAVDGHGHPGDPDLVMHFAVLRDHGRALLGPAADAVFPAIPRGMMLEAFRGELEWARENASPSYQVLNACRAWRYVDEGLICSKMAGGVWARERVGDRPTIDAALRHRRGLTDTHPDPAAARAFLLGALERLERSVARTGHPLVQLRGDD